MFRGFATRAGFDPVTIDVVSRLVLEHLLLPRVATRHDLDDPEVVQDVAARIGDADVLRMLYLLTVADATATGPDVSTPWRSSLIRTLFTRTMDTITADGSRHTPLRSSRIAEVTAQWSDEIPAVEIENHLETMPEAYALRTPAAEVRRHLLLVTPRPAGSDVRIDVVDGDASSDLVLVTSDRSGLLTIVSGVLALSNISIVEARLATRNDGVVVDRFHVVDSLAGGVVDPERWTNVLADLRSALTGQLDLEQRLESKHHDYGSRVDRTVEPEARILDGADHGTHRISLRGADRVGLLHDVAKVMQDLHIDVHFAKIDTQGTQVLDTFHVHIDAGADNELIAARLLDAARVPGLRGASHEAAGKFAR